MNNKSQDYLLYFIKAFASGAANMIPGVSGASIAVVTGTYEKVVESICNVNREAIKTLLSGRVEDFWKQINGNFMLVMSLGLVLSFFSFYQFFNDFCKSQPIMLYSFMSGIVIASGVCVLLRITRWDIVNGAALAAGSIVSALLLSLPPAGAVDVIPWAFVAGICLSSSIFIPGLTTSFTLFVFAHQDGLSSVLFNDRGLLIVLLLGVFLGLMVVPRAVNWLLLKARNVSYAFVAGCIVGGLKVLWPWKHVVTEQVTKLGCITEQTLSLNVSPFSYASVNNQTPDVLLALVMLVAGASIIVLIRRVANE